MGFPTQPLPDSHREHHGVPRTSLDAVRPGEACYDADMEIVRLGAHDREQFDDAYRILAESIAPSEVKPRDALSRTLSRPDYAILVAVERNAVIGMSVLFLPGGDKAALLEYLAVDANRRGAGIGRELFAASTQMADSPMLVEVESVQVAAPNVETLRRQRFYRRLGCRRIVGCTYLLPLAVAGAPPPMDLMAYGRRNHAPVYTSQLRQWLSTIYQGCYGCSATDPRIDRMLAGVSDPVELE